MKQPMSEMKKICCNECGKFLFETDKSGGTAGAIATEKGFLFKMPFLFTKEYDYLFFCSEDCGKLFFKKNIPDNPESRRRLDEIRAKIPGYARNTAAGVIRFKEHLESLQKRKPG